MRRTVVRVSRPATTASRTPSWWKVGLPVVLVLVAAAWWLHPRPQAPKPRGPQDWSPAETLEAFIRAQENGDLDKTKSFVAKAAQAEFAEASHGMTKDDLVATGLQFRGDQYQVEEVGKVVATLYSAHAALYMGMTKEEGRWKVDPHRTDILNREAPARQEQAQQQQQPQAAS
jgi:hypothetical protein